MGLGIIPKDKGIGFNSNTKKQKVKPTQVFEKRINNVPSHSVVHNDTYFLMNPILRRSVIFAIMLVT